MLFELDHIEFIDTEAILKFYVRCMLQVCDYKFRKISYHRKNM